MNIHLFATQEEYDELLRYAVVVPSYPHLPSLTVTSSGPSPAVGQSVQMSSTQSRFAGGVYVVASTAAGSIAAQAAATDVITVCPPVSTTACAEPSASSRSSVHG